MGFAYTAISMPVHFWHELCIGNFCAKSFGIILAMEIYMKKNSTKKFMNYLENMTLQKREPIVECEQTLRSYVAMVVFSLGSYVALTLMVFVFIKHLPSIISLIQSIIWS